MLVKSVTNNSDLKAYEGIFIRKRNDSKVRVIGNFKFLNFPLWLTLSF